MGCEHDYEVLENDLEIETIRFFDGDLSVNVTGCVVFYCPKCLDVQKKVIE